MRRIRYNSMRESSLAKIVFLPTKFIRSLSTFFRLGYPSKDIPKNKNKLITQCEERKIIMLTKRFGFEQFY